MTCDVARGAGQDYSAFTVIDVTEMPYKLVCRYRNNEIPPLLYPSVIEKIAKEYNDAWVMVEANDIGGQVADILYYDIEYENMISTAMKGRSGQVVGTGFAKGSIFGVRTTPQVKRIGCRVLKALIEEKKLLILDFDTVAELTTFCTKSKSYAATEGHFDDLVMTMVLFSWLTNQTYFKDLLDQDLRTRMYSDRMKALEADLTPFGIVDDGLGVDGFVDADGEHWTYV